MSIFDTLLMCTLAFCKEFSLLVIVAIIVYGWFCYQERNTSIVINRFSKALLIFFIILGIVFFGCHVLIFILTRGEIVQPFLLSGWATPFFIVDIAALAIMKSHRVLQFLEKRTWSRVLAKTILHLSVLQVVELLVMFIYAYWLILI